MKTLSWKARRSGPLYCAPACGGKCTWADYTRAKASAAALAKRLGRGWKPRVWENLGWHYEVLDPSKMLRVSCHKTTYTAILNGQWVSHGKTPELVVADVLRQARRAMNTFKWVIDCAAVESRKKAE